MFSCRLLTLIASSLLSHTSIRSLAVHRSLIILRVFFSPSLFLSYLVEATSTMYLIISCGWLRWTCLHIPPTHRCSYQLVSRMTRALYWMCDIQHQHTKHVHKQHYQWIWNNNNFLIIIYETFALQRFPLFHEVSCSLM